MVSKETRFERFAEAYKTLSAKANYRYGAPGNGLGFVFLSEQELQDPEVSEAEARRYVPRFEREEDSLAFFIGCANWPTTRSPVFTIEAARLVCSGMTDKLALKVLRLAISEVEERSDDDL